MLIIAMKKKAAALLCCLLPVFGGCAQKKAADIVETCSMQQDAASLTWQLTAAGDTGLVREMVLTASIPASWIGKDTIDESVQERQEQVKNSLSSLISVPVENIEISFTDTSITAVCTLSDSTQIRQALNLDNSEDATIEALKNALSNELGFGCS